MISAALVMMMTPALAFFYGGMVRKKNILSTLNLSFIMLGLISIQWVLFGYTLAFGHNIGGFIGNLQFIGLTGVGSGPSLAYAPTIPHLSFALYQMMFAVITPALITGAFVERVKFKTFLVFALIWATVVYDPVAHWVWGIGGFLNRMGALDFAGGTVVHVTAGFAALAFAMVIGARKGYGKTPMEPSAIPYTVLGAGLLWMGWFGFNGGSALAANGVAVHAIVNTNTAAAAGAMIWMLLSWRVAATISYYAIQYRQRTRLDESLDVFACHGLGGTTGAILTGLFATKAVNPKGANGLFYGNPKQLAIQIAAVAIVAAFTFVLTFVIAKALDRLMGLRVDEASEEVGLDISEHGEMASA
jgi:Amt family ammonium transporter